MPSCPITSPNCQAGIPPLILRRLGLSGWFTHGFNSAETGYEKPHPQAFHLALQALGACDQVWIVGDNPKADVAGAAAVGLPAVLARQPGSSSSRACADLYQNERSSFLVAFLEAA